MVKNSSSIVSPSIKGPRRPPSSDVSAAYQSPRGPRSSSSWYLLGLGFRVLPTIEDLHHLGLAYSPGYMGGCKIASTPGVSGHMSYIPLENPCNSPLLHPQHNPLKEFRLYLMCRLHFFTPWMDRTLHDPKRKYSGNRNSSGVRLQFLHQQYCFGEFSYSFYSSTVLGDLP